MTHVSELIDNGEANSSYTRTNILTHSLAPIALKFWENRPTDGIIIGRDVPSRAIARLLSHMIVYEPVDEDLRVRVAGAAIRNRFPRDIADLRMSELFNSSDFPVRYNTVMEAIKIGEPRLVCITHNAGEKRDVELFRLELLILPVWSPTRDARWATSFCFYF
jgi:hypothetical protein